MATFQTFEDDLKTCPFDPAHKVARRRYQLHVKDCKLKHPEFKICRFNSVHYIKEGLLEEHERLRCPDRFQSIREHYQTLPNKSNQPQEPAVPVNNGGGDDWSNDAAPQYLHPNLHKGEAKKEPAAANVKKE